MESRSSSNQGGSILVFVVVSLVLVGLLIGGILGVRQFGEDIRFASDSGQVPLEENATDEPTPDGDGSSVESESEDEVQVGESRDDSADTSAQQGNDGSPEADASAPGEMPETGPAETLTSIAVLAALAFVGSSYIQSRKIHWN